MPIGDLLASITGDEPAPKRKAADDAIRHPAPKIARTSSAPIPSSSSRPLPSQPPTRPLDRPNAVQRPVATNGNGNGVRNGAGLGATRTTPSLKPTHDAYRVSKPGATPSRTSASVRPQQQSTTSQTKSGASNGDGATTSGPPKAPPKKGSFAEILARGKAAQATMGQVGKIQHKKTEKGAALRKESSDVGKGSQKPADPRAGGSRPDPRAAPQQARRPSGYAGTAKPNARPGAPSGPTNGRTPAGRPGERDKKSAATAQPEKPKKAAAATTGYTGTARARPGVDAKKSHQQQRGGALLNRQPARPSAARGNSRYDVDEYDDELDDFIEYDDEEDDGLGGRYRYGDESDSDMEAGMDDLELEERRAEQIARREDIEEERREKSLKAAKEERKRKALEELRSKRR